MMSSEGIHFDAQKFHVSLFFGRSTALAIESAIRRSDLFRLLVCLSLCLYVCTRYTLHLFVCLSPELHSIAKGVFDATTEPTA
jgi:hypothetical protein